VFKFLLDEGVPRPILRALPEGEATTVGLIGWSGIRNGDLLRRAEAHGFEVLVTTDKNMRHQNSLVGRRLAVVTSPVPTGPSYAAGSPISLPPSAQRRRVRSSMFRRDRPGVDEVDGR
jgi:hypothetical protein